MNFLEYPDREMLAIDLANQLAGALKAHLMTHETASFAVCGGTSPGLIFDALCAADLEWERVHVLPTDERWVAPDHPRSNARLIRERLLTARAGAARFLPLWEPEESPEAALPAIAARVSPELPLSVMLLGMGEDMHTASLFPGAAGLREALADDAPPVAVLRPETVPEARISLTAPVLDGALSKHMVLYGEAKRAALERALSLPPEEAPVQAVLKNTSVHWSV